MRTTRIQSDAKNLLFDCLLHQVGCCYARSLQARSLRSNYTDWKASKGVVAFDPVYTVRIRGHDIVFGQFEVIFTLTIISLISCC